MTEENIITIINCTAAVSMIVRFRPIFKANSLPELTRLVEHKPRVKKTLAMPIAQTYWLPLVLGSLSLFSIINSMPDELSEQDPNMNEYVYAAFSLLFLMAVWLVHVRRLRKVRAVTGAVEVPLPTLATASMAQFDSVPVPLATAPAKGKIRVVVIAIVALGIILIAYSLANKGEPSGADAKFKSEFAAAAAGSIAPTGSTSAVPLEEGTISANANDLPTKLHTLAGQLSMGTLPSGDTSIFLNEKALYTGDNARYLSIIRHFEIAGNDVVLIASSGANGNSCESQFAFLIFEAGGIKTTPLFGTCSASGRFAQAGDMITLTMPKMGGNSTYTFDGAVIKEDGVVVGDNGTNDPSQ